MWICSTALYSSKLCGNGSHAAFEPSIGKPLGSRARPSHMSIFDNVNSFSKVLRAAHFVHFFAWRAGVFFIAFFVGMVCAKRRANQIEQAAIREPRTKQ
jgi:hypothetical protein